VEQRLILILLLMELITLIVTLHSISSKLMVQDLEVDLLTVLLEEFKYTGLDSRKTKTLHVLSVLRTINH